MPEAPKYPKPSTSGGQRGSKILIDESVSDDELEQKVESSLHGFEEGFRNRFPVLWLTTLLAPFGLLIGAVVVCWWLRGWVFATKLVGAAFVTFFGLGRFVILLGNSGSSAAAAGELERFGFLTQTELFTMVTYMDVAVALFVAFHIGAMFRVPWLGDRVAGLVDDARFVLESMPWMRRLAFIGLTLFVAFPLASTGAIGGSILGTLLGLTRFATFAATVCGCLLGNSLLYLASDAVGKVVDKDNPVVRFGGIAVIVVLVIVMEIRYHRHKKNFHAGQQNATSTDSDVD